MSAADVAVAVLLAICVVTNLIGCVALSQIVVGAVAVPLMFMLAMTKIRQNQEQRNKRAKKGKNTETGVRGTEAA